MVILSIFVFVVLVRVTCSGFIRVVVHLTWKCLGLWRHLLVSIIAEKLGFSLLLNLGFGGWQIISLPSFWVWGNPNVCIVFWNKASMAGRYFGNPPPNCPRNYQKFLKFASVKWMAQYLVACLTLNFYKFAGKHFWIKSRDHNSRVHNMSC